MHIKRKGTPQIATLLSGGVLIYDSVYKPILRQSRVDDTLTFITMLSIASYDKDKTRTIANI